MPAVDPQWDKIVRNIQGYARLGVTRLLTSAADGIVNDVKSTMSTFYAGESSPPGGPPYRRSGYLRGSVQSKIDFKTSTVYVFDDMRYAHYVEFGTSRMKPRPYLRGGLIRYITTQLGAQVEMSYGKVKSPGW